MLHSKITIGPTVAILALCGWALPGLAFAQAESDEGEVAALGGVALGVGARPTVTASTGIGFSKHGMALVSVGFEPLGQHTIQSWPSSIYVDRSLLYDFGVDFHFRIPVGERWAPYGIAGVGLLWNTVRQSTAEGIRHFNQFNGALHTGGGVRFYVSKNWGIRPEVKVVVSKQVYTQILFGFFYVTPANWP